MCPVFQVKYDCAKLGWRDEILKALVDSGVGTVTALCPHIGYSRAAKIAKKALAEHITVKELVLREGILSESELNKILDVRGMTEPGISGKDLL